MGLTKNVTIERREVLEMGQIQVTERIEIIEGETVVSVSENRYVLEPGDDVSNKDEKIKRIAEAEWTDEVVSLWNDFNEN